MMIKGADIGPGKVLTYAVAATGVFALFAGAELFFRTRFIREYNKTAAEEYISSICPGATVTNNLYNDDCLICYDRDNDIFFAQYFTHDKKGRLIPSSESGGQGYAEALAAKERCEKCMEVIPDAYDGEYFTRMDPARTSGFLVFIKKGDYRKANRLRHDLREAINKYPYAESPEFMIVLCGDKSYELFDKADFDGYAVEKGYACMSFANIEDLSQLIGARCTFRSAQYGDMPDPDFFVNGLAAPGYKAGDEEILTYWGGQPYSNDQKYSYYDLFWDLEE